LRHLTEVIAEHRWYPPADRNLVAGVLNGEHSAITNVELVMAVARACHKIAGTPFPEVDQTALRTAVAHLGHLIAEARSRDMQAPRLLPMPQQRVDARDPSTRSRSTTTWAISAAAAAVLATAVVVTVIAVRPGLQPSHAQNPSATSTYDPDSTIMKAMLEVEKCAENIRIDPRVAGASLVKAHEPGPADAPAPNRRIELHFAQDARLGWLAWARYAQSASIRDRMWIDWSYLNSPTPGKTDQWRQCGPYPITAGRDTTAIQAVDNAGRPRWFRACGQAPREDRPPTSKRNSFCTGWHQPPSVD
jgi:hypothetical protein